MNKSIQRFLTINALSVVGLSTLLATIAIFFLRQDSIKLHLNAELSLEARSIEPFLTKRLSSQELNNIQIKINNIPLEATSETPIDTDNEALLKGILNSTQFQVWDLRRQELILRSPSAPSIPLDSKLGLQNIQHQSHQWTTYSIEISNLNYKIVTMQRHDMRLGYEQQLITDTLIVISLCFLFLGFSLKLIISRSLVTLEKTTSQLKKNEPSNLEALRYNNAPSEVQPLIIEINRLMFQLKSALEREQQFAADAAHELKTPLATMKAQIQLMTRLPPESQQKAIYDLEKTIERYDHIIRQLLSLSRTLSHTTLETEQWIDLDAVTQNVIAPLVPLALKKDINIELHHKTLPKILSNASLLTTVLSNLIDNAIKYTTDGDTIMVTITPHSSQVYIEVIDHGPGIPDESKQLALQRFSRLYNTKSSGSGLGLSIVEEICQHLHGTLSLHDSSPKGLTSRIALPINFKNLNHHDY
ncbi:sensor histidine kinase [Candidatus Synchoanobacter obligatus]|uniref:histidine kinase n=1 Tax=Candidatus Synchoanobacter obligatus TaxID=2919597 RepID=A0ABT1L777_9GAMM|nr:ATP-binding protein [Candidatus Synchoanobacter obligatus]MCP8352658.1 ATP-binding protein [Candidatus Synchoanobacter obligatus]